MTFAPRTWVVGETVSAAIMNQEIRDQFNSMFAAWTPYTPAWTSTGTAPAIGNGTLTGRYMKFGRTVFVNINCVAGSTTTFGSGNYSWSLPFQAASSGVLVVGTGHLLNGSNRYVGNIVVSSAATTAGVFVPKTTSTTLSDFVTATQPETLASSAQVRLSFVYEAAA